MVDMLIRQEKLASSRPGLANCPGNGGYEGLSDDQKNEKLKTDFDRFLRKRGQIVMRAVNLLVEGRQLNAGEIFEG
jgi:hypothetical protein